MLSKRRRLSPVVIEADEQSQSHPHQNDHGHSTTSSSSDKGKRKGSDTFNPSNSEVVDQVYPSYKEQIKRYANQLLQNDQNTIELKPNGGVLITPYQHGQQLADDESPLCQHLPNTTPQSQQKQQRDTVPQFRQQLSNTAVPQQQQQQHEIPPQPPQQFSNTTLPQQQQQTHEIPPQLPQQLSNMIIPHQQQQHAIPPQILQQSSNETPSQPLSHATLPQPRKPISDTYQQQPPDDILFDPRQHVSNSSFSGPSQQWSVNALLTQPCPSPPTNGARYYPPCPPTQEEMQLPNTLMYKILQHVPRQPRRTLYECALVNKNFNAIANSFLWKVLDFEDDKHHNPIDTSCFHHCFAQLRPARLNLIGQYIHELHLMGPLWTDAHLERLLRKVPYLNFLSIRAAPNISDASLQYLPTHCRRLHSLKLYATQVQKTTFSALGQRCRQLRILEWELCNDQTSKWLTLLTSCPLEHLRIINCPAGDENNTSIRIIRYFDRLTRLHYTPIYPKHMDSLLQPPVLATTYGNDSNLLWHRMTHLTLSPCFEISGPTLFNFIACHPYLQRIELTNAKNVSDMHVDAMAVDLPRLTHLALTGSRDLSPEAVRRLIQGNSPNLVMVNLYHCGHVMQHHFPESTSSDGPRVILDRNAIEKIKIISLE